MRRMRSYSASASGQSPVQGEKKTSAIPTFSAHVASPQSPILIRNKQRRDFIILLAELRDEHPGVFSDLAQHPFFLNFTEDAILDFLDKVQADLAFLGLQLEQQRKQYAVNGTKVSRNLYRLTTLPGITLEHLISNPEVPASSLVPEVPVKTRRTYIKRKVGKILSPASKPEAVKEPIAPEASAISDMALLGDFFRDDWKKIGVATGRTYMRNMAEKKAKKEIFDAVNYSISDITDRDFIPTFKSHLGGHKESLSPADVLVREVPDDCSPRRQTLKVKADSLIYLHFIDSDNSDISIRQYNFEEHFGISLCAEPQFMLAAQAIAQALQKASKIPEELRVFAPKSGDRLRVELNFDEQVGTFVLATNLKDFSAAFEPYRKFFLAILWQCLYAFPESKRALTLRNL